MPCFGQRPAKDSATETRSDNAISHDLEPLVIDFANGLRSQCLILPGIIGLYGTRREIHRNLL